MAHVPVLGHFARVPGRNFCCQRIYRQLRQLCHRPLFINHLQEIVAELIERLVVICVGQQTTNVAGGVA